MNRKLVLRALIILAAGGAILAAAFGGLYLTREQSPNVAGTAWKDKTFAEPGSVPIGGPFTLIDDTGKTVTDKNFRGKYLLVFFGYTHCPDVCPTTLSEIARALDLLDNQAEAVQPLFISVDPDRDSPKTVAEYVQAFHPKIIGLTGSKEQIDKVVEEYRVFYEKVSAAKYFGTSSQQTQDATKLGNDYLVSHSGSTYLMSPEGDYLTHFAYGTKPEKMADTVRKAVAKFGRPNR